ncbi:MAG TPA: hypothetical protein PLF88_06215 [Opitutaceae bacterium]|nr:hypothetical protein [Opitutaceae bacterium]HRJ48219.1 hypothetical protein [Opitutaceae bacterium]
MKHPLKAEVCVNLSGRPGNQTFRHATGLALAWLPRLHFSAKTKTTCQRLQKYTSASVSQPSPPQSAPQTACSKDI